MDREEDRLFENYSNFVIMYLKNIDSEKDIRRDKLAELAAQQKEAVDYTQFMEDAVLPGFERTARADSVNSDPTFSTLISYEKMIREKQELELKRQEMIQAMCGMLVLYEKIDVALGMLETREYQVLQDRYISNMGVEEMCLNYMCGRSKLYRMLNQAIGRLVTLVRTADFDPVVVYACQNQLV